MPTGSRPPILHPRRHSRHRHSSHPDGRRGAPQGPAGLHWILSRRIHDGPSKLDLRPAGAGTAWLCAANLIAIICAS